MNLKNKVIVITGGATGLGFALAQQLVKKESVVHIVSHNPQNLQAAGHKINSPLLKTHYGDVTDYAAIQAVIAEIGRVDVLSNNAGVWLEGQVVDNQVEEIANTIDVNIKGVIFTTKAALPLMLKANEGHIVNVVSTSGLKGRFDQSVYVASKFGASGFTKSLQEDLAKTNIKVAGFYPGGMKTELFAKAGFPKENQDWMDPDQVAEVIIFMLERDETMIMDHVVLNKRQTKVSN